LFWLKPGAELSTPAGSGDWLKATLVLIFAYGGFEAALMPMGEAKNPRRDAPFALFTALVACTLLYTLILAVVLNLLPNPASASRPLAAAAREFMGPAGAILITLGALISVYGYLSSQMLNSPRLTYALAEKRDFPDFFKAIHEKYRTPHASIIIFALLLWGLAVVGSFKWNVFLSAVARLFTYGLVCAALIVLRRKRPDCLAFRLPGGYLFSVLGVLFSLVLVSQMGLTETLIISATVAIAGMNWLWVRRAWPAGDNS
jgi:amino acid transporter